MRTLSIIVASTAMLAACTTTDPYTGEAKRSNTAKGATIGAVIGGVAGALSNTSDGDQALKNAAIGATAGAAIGGGVGVYMDRQEAKLRQQLQGSGVSVTRVGDQIILNMPSNITFATDQYNINQGFYETLDSVVLVLKEFKDTSIDVVGHTDSTGSEAYNQTLSQRRAGSVSNYLTNQGVHPQRLQILGFGETRPIADNGTEMGRAQNRRVEVQIAPNV